VAREEYKRTYKFFDKIHVNNTKKVLMQQHEEIAAQLPKLEASYERACGEYEEGQERRLEQFDAALEKIYEALLVNLGRKSNKGGA
jgi:putative hemolysin